MAVWVDPGFTPRKEAQTVLLPLHYTNLCTTVSKKTPQSPARSSSLVPKE